MQCGKDPWFWLIFGAAVALPQPAFADRLEAGAPAALFSIETAVGGLNAPTSFGWLPDGRVVIADRNGDVLIASVGGTAEVIGNIPVEPNKDVGGLLNMVVHPDFEENRTLIFAIAGNPPPATGRDEDGHRISAFALDEDFKLDVMKEKILVGNLRRVSKHDGGALAIGPDRKLYVGIGDTGCLSGMAPEPVYDPYNYFATCLTNANGKILRVNLDGSVPPDNPLVGKAVTMCGDGCRSELPGPPNGPAREEIWAWGFRNPWRFWFDPKTESLWVGDVGEVTYEELDIIPKNGAGRHYGWPWREADRGHPKDSCNRTDPAGDCQDPAYYCAHGKVEGVDANCSAIIAGAIVDSCQFPESFRGKYFFGDNTGSWIATLDVNGERDGVVPDSRKMFAKTDGGPVHFAIGPDGALYYAVLGQSGSIQRITPRTPERCSSAPRPRDGGRPMAGAGGHPMAGAGGRDAGGGAIMDGAVAAAGGADPGTTDAGAGGSAGADSGTAGSGGAPPALTMGSGCNCTLPGEARGVPRAWLSLSAVSLLIARRRARRLSSLRA
jgi:glucose/arabinose dehydrogenase